MNKAVKYKVLEKNLTSPFKNFQFEQDKWYHCDNFDSDPRNDCSNGFYCTDLDGLIYSFNIHRKVFECETKGKSVEINKYKMRYERFKLGREIPHDELKKLLIENKIDEAEGFKYTEAMFPINPVIVKRKKGVSEDEIKLLQEWASVWDSVRASVWDSVWASVWDSVRDSAWDSVRASVRDSAWDSVRASVGVSVWDSVRDSVWDSVWDSAWDSVRASVGVYFSSLFPNIKFKHDFSSGTALWKAGLVPFKQGDEFKLYSCNGIEDFALTGGKK